MQHSLRALRVIIAALSLSGPCAWADTAAIHWQPSLTEATFAQAAREHKFILLDLHAVWCHWCHVMDTTTYADSRIQADVDQHYIAVGVDADSDPALASRYGDWGWPATIVFAPDATEIVKRRGYLAPPQMLSLLEAIVADPTPGPSVGASMSVGTGSSTSLGEQRRAALNRSVNEHYDESHDGWGTQHKYLDAAAMEWTLEQLDEGDQSALRRARRTLDANLNLIDPIWGGVYQYSDSIDWKSPHFEKLLAFQADDLRLYSEAYARWHRQRDLDASRALYRYLTTFLSAPDGGFYTSQDADVSTSLTGPEFYKLNDADRRARGMPGIDIHEYSREAGWAIRALCKYYDVTGERDALVRAERAARWALTTRGIPREGFSHGAPDHGGPFLDDNVSMTAAFLALYRSTGTREWLHRAQGALHFIDTQLRDKRAGYVAAPPNPGGSGVFREPVRDSGQNAALVRAASLLHHYTGGDQALQVSQHGMMYLTALAAADSAQYRPEILLADHELNVAPVHITVVGSKDDPAAAALHAAALRFPGDYLQVDWWDRREGKLPDPTISYPLLPRAAAFACTANSCSTPIFDATQLQDRVRAALSGS